MGKRVYIACVMPESDRQHHPCVSHRCDVRTLLILTVTLRTGGQARGLGEHHPPALQFFLDSTTKLSPFAHAPPLHPTPSPPKGKNQRPVSPKLTLSGF